MLIDAPSLLLPIAHAGPGSTWQAMIVVAGVMLTLIMLAASFGRLDIDKPGDLLVPLAGTAILSSVGVLGHMIISDGIGWGLPLAVISLAALLLSAFTKLDIRLPAPLPMGAIALSIVACIILYVPLTIALHPPADLLPLADDSEVLIDAPADGDTIEAGNLEVTVSVTGGSIGPQVLPLEELPVDPEEAGALAVALEEVRDDDAPSQQQLIEVDYGDGCTLDDPCETVTFDVPVEPGRWELTVEFTRGDGTPLAPFRRDSIEIEAS